MDKETILELIAGIACLVMAIAMAFICVSASGYHWE